jgi:hypothetical protein
MAQTLVSTPQPSDFAPGNQNFLRSVGMKMTHLFFQISSAQGYLTELTVFFQFVLISSKRLPIDLGFSFLY